MKSSFDWDAACDMYSAGCGDEAIAKALGCSGSLVSMWRRRTGRDPLGGSRVMRAIPKELYQKLEARLLAREPLQDIADSMDVYVETIRKFATRRGLPITQRCVKTRPEIVGGTLDRSGYVLLRVARSGPYGYLIRANTRNDEYGYAPIHRMRMHDKLGRKLTENEVVHHVDGDIYNNSPANLEVFQSNGEHLKETLKGKVPNWTPEGKARMTGRPKTPRA